MRKKKVLLITIGNYDNGGARIRVLHHFERLKDLYDADWVPRTGYYIRKTWRDKFLYMLVKWIYALKLFVAIFFKKYDLVFIQTMFLSKFYLKWLKSKNTIIVYDFDDAIYSYSESKFNIMMKYADKVVVASPFLQQHIKDFNKDCIVIPSPVDTDIILPNWKQSDQFTIGWIGSPWTLPHLKMIQNVFKHKDYKLLIVGGELEIEGVEVECIPWSEQNQIDALERIDIGIMPLRNDAWSQMKGGYKLYLYMAAGKAIIASPYGINKIIVKEGINGFLAETEQEWVNAFERLQMDHELRNKMGLASRRDAEELYSYNVCTPRLLEFLNKV